MTCPLQPVSDVLLVKPVDTGRTLEWGLYLPGITEKPEQGEVIARGPGKMLPDGSRAEMLTKVGSKIVFNPNMVQEVAVDGVAYKAVREEHIYAIVE